MLNSWDHQDFQVPACPAAVEQESCESVEPQKLNPISVTAALQGSSSAAAPSRVPLRQGCCCPHSLAPLVHCQSLPGWDAAQVPPRAAGEGSGLCTNVLMCIRELHATEPEDPGSSRAHPSSRCWTGRTFRVHARPLIYSALHLSGL